MAKRFTDTNKWKMAWYRKLGSEGRDIFNYVYENCDAAGIFELDLERMSFELGLEITLPRIEACLQGKVERISDDRLFLPAFIDFQYGELSESCHPHRSVIKRLADFGISKGSLRVLGTLQDKDKDKDKDKEGGCGGKLKFDLAALYAKYPRKQGKSAGLKKLKAAIKTQDDYERVSTAIEKFIEHHRQAKTEAEFIPYFSSFMSQWTDWTDSETGAVVDFSAAKKEMNWDFVFGKEGAK